MAEPHIPAGKQSSLRGAAVDAPAQQKARHQASRAVLASRKTTGGQAYKRRQHRPDEPARAAVALHGKSPMHRADEAEDHGAVDPHKTSASRPMAPRRYVQRRHRRRGDQPLETHEAGKGGAVEEPSFIFGWYPAQLVSPGAGRGSPAPAMRRRQEQWRRRRSRSGSSPGRGISMARWGRGRSPSMSEG